MIAAEFHQQQIEQVLWNEHESLRLFTYFAPIRRGQNRHCHNLMQAFFERIAWGLSECWFWVGSRNDTGYGMFAAARQYDSDEIIAHRLSWTIFKGPIPEGLKVLHTCDIRACVNPDHLFLGSQADNVHDMIAKRRHRIVSQPGEKNAAAKLTASQVLAMRSRYAEGGISYKTLASQFNVTTMTAFRAVTGQCWSHL